MTPVGPLFALVVAMTAAPPPAAATVAGATRRVVRAVADRAGQLARPAARLTGDELTAEYVRAAAAAAHREDARIRVTAFLVGLGIALDDSATLRDNPLTGVAVKAAESDAERRARLAVLGQPTVRGRRDSCQHFAVSAALAELVGPAAAESAGLAKELLDMSRRGGSGFSFADLAADYAGLALAEKVRADPDALDGIARGFAADDYMPAFDGLREGLTASTFAADYGSADDPRLRAAVGAVRKRVADLPAYKK